MNNRQRFHAAMQFQPVDRLPHIEQGFWEQTYRRWQAEGLPPTVTYPELFGSTPANDLFGYFDISKIAYARVEQYYLPAFSQETLEETEHHRVFRNERGVLLRDMKASVSMPQFLDYPIKTRADYQALRDRLHGSPDQRYPSAWEEQATDFRRQERDVVAIHVDGFFAYPRELLGVERLMYAFHDEPDLIALLTGDHLAMIKALCPRLVEEARPDFVFIWEDMCYKNGPLISPAMFRRFLLPAYQELTAFFKKMGINIFFVDSDGSVERLIPLWLEGGVTGLLPFEVKAGLDVLTARKRYPNLQILGGIEKHALEGDPAQIDAELKRVLPAMGKSGGYVASLDHWVHSEIPLANFAYYVDAVRCFQPARGW